MVASLPHRVLHAYSAVSALRSMVYWIEHVCSQNISNEHDRLRAAMFKAFADADRVCRRAGRHFTPQQHLEFNANLEAALVSYNALAVEALSQKKGESCLEVAPEASRCHTLLRYPHQSPQGSMQSR